ncbi:MAG: SUMF1/EgtB/PvdO family nonheme iron enzyme [Symploca sp. SIO2D2]|nr:SUMF1/EgtB/PvdO family nonheme iron enzyme [Symploca sp. SIO2D2]
MTEKFQLAANVLLSRRMNNLVRIEENVEIDLNYITCAEYQLFIDEMRQAGENRQPDHWQDYIFPREDALKPITGVRASDAEEFCAWLTQRKSTLGRYRLPTLAEAEENTLAEAEENSATEQQIGCWSNDEGEQVIAGIEPTQLQDWHSNLAEVTILNRNLDRVLYGDLDRVLYRVLYQVPYGDLYGSLHRDFHQVPYGDLYGALHQDLYRDLNRVLYGDLNRDLNRILFRVLNRNLNRNLYQNLNQNLYQNLNQNLYQVLNRDLSRDLNRNLYQVLYQRIEANEASDFLILYFPLLFFIVIYQILSRTYQATSQDREALRQISREHPILENILGKLRRVLGFQGIRQSALGQNTPSGQESEAISHKYQKKIDEIYSLYVYLVLQDERQAGRIPAWEGIRIVRENFKSL